MLRTIQYVISTFVLLGWYGCAFGGIHRIPHIPDGNWKTKIELCNDSVEAEQATVEWWDEQGMQHSLDPIFIYGNTTVEIDCAQAGIANVAQVTTKIQSMVKVKLSYQYGNSESLCEFLIPDDHLSTEWEMPNTQYDHFDWFGLAVASFRDQAVAITLDAYRNGELVGEANVDINSHQKLVNISSGIWPGLNYHDVDFVIVKSDYPIPAPISITGNSQQDRHVFFLAQQLTDSENAATFVVPHIAEDPWTTTITAYNSSDQYIGFSLSTWNENVAAKTASVDAANVSMHVVSPGQQLELRSGVDFPFGGMAVIDGTEGLSFKLGYQYGESKSVCEFFLSQEKSHRWFFPAAKPGWFDWTGLAVANPNDSPVNVSFRAIQNGQIVGVSQQKILPHSKLVGLAHNFWENLDAADIDMIVVQSAMKIGSPILIMGNSEQDRHVFFEGVKDFSSEDFIPDPTFRAFLLEHIDLNHNGQIDQEEAESVIAIVTPGSKDENGNIRDITGVEQFHNLQTLVCAYNQLTFLPDLSGLVYLEKLEFPANNVSMFPDISSLTDLKALNCSFNPISELPDLSKFVQLEYLDVTMNQGVSEILGLSNLSKLKTLRASGTGISDISGLANASQLEDLEVSGTNVSDVSFISNFENLKTLDLSSSQVRTLPDLTGVVKLEELNCSGISLEALPDLSHQLELKKLEVVDCGLSNLNGINHCTKLESLSCGSNNITELPDLSGLTALQTLSAYMNQISVISGLEDLTSLQHLNLAENYLQNLPDMSNLKNLEFLNVNDNELNQIPDLSAFSKLEEFSCEENPDLTELTGLSSLLELTYLDISTTSISSLGDLSNLTKLKYLYLWEATEIQQIQGLSKLTSLEALECYHTQVSNLEGIGELQNLKYLDCGMCNLTDIPDVTTCSSLSEFKCAYNQFGPDDCPLIQQIKAMNLDTFEYNPQIDESDVICE